LGGYGLSACSLLASAGKNIAKKGASKVALFGRVLHGFELRRATAAIPTARPQTLLCDFETFFPAGCEWGCDLKSRSHLQSKNSKNKKIAIISTQTQLHLSRYHASYNLLLPLLYHRFLRQQNNLHKP